VKGLTQSELRFCDVILTQERRNGTQAVLQIYKQFTKCDSAAGKAHRLLRNPKIQNYLVKRNKELLEDLNINPLSILGEDKTLAFADIRKLFTKEGTMVAPWDLPEDIAKCVVGLDVTERYNGKEKSITYKYRLADKGKALERLGRYLKLYDKEDRGISLQEILDSLPAVYAALLIKLMKVEQLGPQKQIEGP